VYRGRKSRLFATRTVLPPTRASATFADSVFAKRDIPFVQPISGFAHT
jgi:hypothetical protein